MEKIYDYYKVTEEENLKRADVLKRRIHLIGTIRALVTLAFIVAMIFLIDQGWVLLGVVALAFAIPFAALMVYQNRLTSRKSYAEALATLCHDELNGLDYDFSTFDGAPDKVDAEHSFGLDLDIFGDRSFFQSVNRTVTDGGRETLAGWFIEPLHDKAQILKRQEAVRELGAETKLRQHFHVTGTLNRGDKSDTGLVSSLIGRNGGFAGNTIWRTLVWVMPAMWIAIAAGYFLNIISEIVPIIFFLVSFVFSILKIKEINAVHNSAGKMEKILSVYSHLIAIIENARFDAPLLKDIKADIGSGGHSASRAVMQLSRRINALDQRSNMIVAIINIFTLRDIRIVMRIEKWKRDNEAYVARWFKALAEFDALSSLAGFAFNHPDYIYPYIADDYFVISGEGLGHPLMNRAVCVKNDISIGNAPCFMIVTGANMAGKSTYLRTVGINFILACIGAPVCAERLTVFPASLVTSLRTSDSLPDNESYFYAELKRLKMIIERLRSGEKLFIILDEILKGTNSIDKQKGSLALIRQFISYRTCGIIATHDLVLGSLSDEFPDYVRNFRFEAEITGDKLSFSYRMQDGVARNMNAWFLMKKMGITVD